ncbi:RICIN domain-containing protein [Sorangium sp. So ce315]|uniref:RICIN domain-containing protein n=1 Tax=Sorangium sp. So ce315 TaxID=3133299 RepID=UPI003F60A979
MRSSSPLSLLALSLFGALLSAGCVSGSAEEILADDDVLEEEETGVAESALSIPGTVGSIAIEHSGKCLDVFGGYTANGAALTQYDCASYAGNQKLQLVDQGDGSFLLVAKHSGKCMDVSGASTANGAAAVQWDCHGGANQRFELISQGGAYHGLRARHSGKCLDLEGASMANGAPIIQWDCHGGANQRFRLNDPYLELAQAFAPRLRFDSAASDYPMSAQTFWDNGRTGENTEYGTIVRNEVPTYYQVIKCGNQVRIMYWWFYGHQDTCDGVSGAHDGDWERVMVTLAENDRSIAAVTYWIHGDAYTRLRARGGVDNIEDGPHVVVHVGKTSHASYHEQGGSGSCLPWEDFHNDGSQHLNSWNRLVSLDQDAEPWMAADRQGNFAWGWDNPISTHPTLNGPSCDMDAATSIHVWRGTQCKLGDDDTGVECLRQCASGYTNGGLICTNWSTWHSYARERYGYGYWLPTSNLGLLTEDY